MARLVKVNRRRRGIILRKTDEKGKKRITLVVMYDDLSKAKKPPAWMKRRARYKRRWIHCAVCLPWRRVEQCAVC